MYKYGICMQDQSATLIECDMKIEELMENILTHTYIIVRPLNTVKYDRLENKAYFTETAIITKHIISVDYAEAEDEEESN